MATITVSSSTTLALLSYAAGDDIVITGATTLTVDANPTALPAIRSIRSTDPRSKLYIRNPATAYTSGNLWRVPFENGGSVVGTGGTLAFSGGATCEIDGEWLTCYTATGTANETVLDASNVIGADVDFPYFIQAETAVGSGVYKAVPVIPVGGVGNGFIATSLQNRFGTGEVGKVLFYDHTTRLLKTGDGTNGTLFVSGVKFRIPNILMWIPAFTMTVGAAGWTTGTGAQPVVSSTNAPVNTTTAIPSYLVGSEMLNVSAISSGTSVNAGGRAQDGTTAAAHASGTVMYCLPNRNINMAGKILSSPSGFYILKKCFFSRWWVPYFSGYITVDIDEAGLIAPTPPNTGLEFSSAQGTTAITNSVVMGPPARVAQTVISSSGMGGPFDMTGTLFLAVVSTVGTAGYGNVDPATFTSTTSITGMNETRFWRAGLPAGISFIQKGPTFVGSATSPEVTVISGVQCVGLFFSTGTFTDVLFTGYRYSQTNGPQNTTVTDDLAFAANVNQTRLVVHDFGILDGGVAPYDRWFQFSRSQTSCIIHNKVNGTPTTIDCQGRTRRICDQFDGTSNIFSSAYFSNMRANGQTIIQRGIAATNNTVRNVRYSDLNGGASRDDNNIPGSRGMVLDFPGGALEPGLTGSIDCQAIYAAPHTWPSLLGGIWVGPVSLEEQLDLYEVSGGAYITHTGSISIEPSGAVAIIKSTAPVTGVGSITGGAPVYTSASTSGLTYEFRLCNWGDDITLVSWSSFTGANVQSAFNALTGYTIYRGLNFQLKITATTTVASRAFQQCYVPVQMDTAYNPPVSAVMLGLVAANPGATAAFYYGPSDTLIQSETVAGDGTASVSAPYDFDGSTVDYRIKVRAVASSSVDVSGTYARLGATAPTPQSALTGYTAGPYAGASFNKATKVVTVTTGMTTAQLWSAWREYITQVANFDVDDTWSYPTLNAPDWTITTSGGGSISGTYADVNGAYVSASISNIVNGSRILIQRTDTSAVLANAIVSGTTYGYTVQTATAIPIRVVLRKASTSPFYQEWSTTGLIEPVGGFAATANQIPD